MLYDLTYLSLKPNTLGPVLARLPQTVPLAFPKGRLLGCFLSEFGTLNRFAILAAYTDYDACAADRAALIRQGDLFGIEAHLAGAERVALQPLSFAQPIEPGAHGPFYEIRTYTLATGGLAATAAAWEKGIAPRAALSPLMTVAHTIDALPQRLVHIWPYRSLDARAAARAQASRDKVWPAPGSGDHLTAMHNELFVATGFSPLT